MPVAAQQLGDGVAARAHAAGARVHDHAFVLDAVLAGADKAALRAQALEPQPAAGGEHLDDGAGDASADAGELAQARLAAPLVDLAQRARPALDGVGGALERAGCECIGALLLQPLAGLPQARRDAQVFARGSVCHGSTMNLGRARGLTWLNQPLRDGRSSFQSSYQATPATPAAPAIASSAGPIGANLNTSASGAT